MTYESLFGLTITDDTLYTQYREHMMPILERYGGGFRYDFKIAETMKSEIGQPMNRVFVIFFKDKKSKEDFFSDDEYQKVKAKYFDKSVEKITLISEYEVAS